MLVLLINDDMKAEEILLREGSYCWKNRKNKDKVRIPRSQALTKQI